MRASEERAEASQKRDKGRPVFVSVGIVLFIAGFLITVMFSAAGSIDGSGFSSEGSTDTDPHPASAFENTMALLGIFIGLLGVVTATVGPLTTVMVSKGRR